MEELVTGMILPVVLNAIIRTESVPTSSGIIARSGGSVKRN